MHPLLPRVLLWAGLGTMFAEAVLLAITFFRAYLRPEKAITIYVDAMGEGDFEVVLITAMLFLWAYTLIRLYRRFPLKLKT